MNVARPVDGDPGEPAAAEGGQDRDAPGPVHGLFQRRFAGDDALLELAALRFAQILAEHLPEAAMDNRFATLPL